MMAQHSTHGGSHSPYDAARTHAAFLDRTNARGRIAVRGADRGSYLQGLLTNDVAGLSTGHGCYAAYLTAQGRMISDAYVYEIGDLMLIAVSRDVKDAVIAKLDQFIFSEDVQLGDVSETFAEIAVVGPDAADVLAPIVQTPLTALTTEHDNVRTTTAGGAVAIVTRIADAGIPGFGVYIERSGVDELMTSLKGEGIPALDDSAAEALRIEAGVPLFGRDMDAETIPLEAGIESRAISFTKGCYVGQEVVIRVLHRGHGRVARRLVGLLVRGRTPVKGATIRAGDREIGIVTSAASSPSIGGPVALGYVHRDFVEPGTAVTVDGETAEVVRLPITSESVPHPRAETPA